MVKKPLAEPGAGDPRDAVVDALLALAGERPWAEITLPDIAARAGMPLRELRAQFPSKGAILGAFARRIDLAVLADESKDLSGEPARERLFDVLMRRLDALAPYKPALRGIRAGITREPIALAAMNRVVVTSMQWMLAAAGISEDGSIGAMKAQALALSWSRVLNTFLSDDDPGLAATLRILDREMRTAERLARRGRDLQDAFGAVYRAACRITGQDRVRPPEAAAEEPTPSI